MSGKQKRTFPYEYGLQLLQGKWQPKLISTIYYHRSITYSDIRHYLAPISDTVLSLTLHRLMDEGIVTKSMLKRVPRVDGYSLTAKGKALVPVLHVLCRWSAVYHKRSAQTFEPICADCPIRNGLCNPLQCADEYHFAPVDEDAAPLKA